MSDARRDDGDAFQALGDGTRRAILSLLAAGARSVQELADELPVSRPAVSRHLRVLESAGLVAEERIGTRHVFRLHEAGLSAVRDYLDRVWGESAARFVLFAENTEQSADRP